VFPQTKLLYVLSPCKRTKNLITIKICNLQIELAYSNAEGCINLEFEQMSMPMMIVTHKGRTIRKVMGGGGDFLRGNIYFFVHL
jgi:hypothetical protein